MLVSSVDAALSNCRRRRDEKKVIVDTRDHLNSRWSVVANGLDLHVAREMLRERDGHRHD